MTSRLRGRPAVLLAAAALLVALGLLAATGPSPYTQRPLHRAQVPVALGPQNVCVPLTVIPAETDAVRLVRAPGAEPPAHVTLRAPGLTLASGPPTSADGGPAVVYPLPRATGTDRLGAQLCLQGGTAVLGEGPNPSVALLGARRGSWLSAIPLLAERASVGRGTVLGRAALPLAVLALVGACTLLIGLATRHGRPNAPPLGRRELALLGLAGTLFATAYAVTTPPFQVPDESEHLRYAELLHDTRALPRTSDPAGGQMSSQLFAARLAMQFGNVQFAADRRPPWTLAEDRAADDALAALPSGDSRDAFDQASSQPPTYYALVAAAITVTGGSSLDHLLVGRLVSALLFGLAVAGAAAFAREAVPRAGPGLTVAAAGVFAALPIAGFVGGGVNPDALLAATAAWTFAVLARLLRRGPTLRLGLALGALTGLGVMAKLTFLGLLPMLLLAAAVLLVRAARAGRLRRDLSVLAAAAAAAVCIALPFYGWAIGSGRGIVFGPAGPPMDPVSIRETLSYMVGLFVGEVGPVERRLAVSGPIDIWGDGLVGRLGWLDYGFPRGAMLAILAAWGVLAAVAAAGVARAARARRAVPVDALLYAAGALGLAFVIARAGLVANLRGDGGFEQARYLLPVAAVGVGGVALALRQLPRPAWQAVAAAVVLVGACAHGVAGWLITVGRYFA